MADRFDGTFDPVYDGGSDDDDDYGSDLDNDDDYERAEESYPDAFAWRSPLPDSPQR